MGQQTREEQNVLTLDHPELKAALEDGEPAAVVADWLMDHDATETDMAVLFAGRGPEHDEGIGQEALGAWVRGQAAVRGQAWLGSANIIDQSRIERYEDWDGEAPERNWGVFTDSPLWAVSRHETEMQAIRAMKRTLLSLPWARDVRVEHKIEVPLNDGSLMHPVSYFRFEEMWTETSAEEERLLVGEFWKSTLGNDPARRRLASLGWHPDPVQESVRVKLRNLHRVDRTLHLCVRQTLTAAQLIWLEPPCTLAAGEAIRPGDPIWIDAQGRATNNGIGRLREHIVGYANESPRPDGTIVVQRSHSAWPRDPNAEIILLRVAP